ncbi:MAG: hypothetical protein MRQ09_06630, partial [Candidatus Midichloria sp.]|nr:hypothetical protein [Candidatus Midichloria sp.]
HGKIGSQAYSLRQTEVIFKGFKSFLEALIFIGSKFEDRQNGWPSNTVIYSPFQHLCGLDGPAAKNGISLKQLRDGSICMLL